MPSGARLGGTIHGLGARVVRTTGDPAAAAAALNRRADVEYAEVDQPMQLLATPNDPRFRELYGLNNTGQTGGVADADIDAPEGWDVAGMGAFPQTGGVKVGIVDTGITQTHEDLAGKTVDCGQSRRAAAITVRRVPRRQRPRHPRRRHDHREREQRPRRRPASRSTRRCRSARP